MQKCELCGRESFLTVNEFRIDLDEGKIMIVMICDTCIKRKSKIKGKDTLR